MQYLLQYQISDDYMKKRALYWEEHPSLAWQTAERGELLLGGAVGEPVKSAQLLVNVDDLAVVEAFAESYPYVINELVTQYKVLPWTTVIGEYASNPVK